MARFKLRQVIVLAVMVCALAAGGGFYWSRLRASARPVDLVALLPSANASVVYIDVAAMRRSGLLSLMAGTKTVEEPDYRQFVGETKFDYRQDLDAVAAAFKDGRVFFALRGHFHWDSLRDYAVRQGGSCHKDFCVLSGSQPTRRISFYPVKSDVMAMAIGPDEFAAYQVTAQPAHLALDQPKEAMWAMIPAVALQRMDSLPSVAKAYVPALQGAEQIVFSMRADASNQLQLSIQVTCTDATAASALLAQFENITSTLRQGLAKAHQKADPADLGGVLVAGTFHRNEREVFGAWPIPRPLFDAIVGGAY